MKAPAPPPTATANGAPRTLPGVAATTAPAAAKAAPGGSALLQIGAYKSQADADAAWRTYKSRHAALLAGYGPDVQRADLGEKGIWYRLRIAGFANRDVASALCDRLKADGASCFLGK
jgi:cell division septation protein DedD